MTLNYSKTEFVDFSKPEVSVNRLRLKVDGNLIRQVKESKFLGVFIDNDISWRVHIGRVMGKDKSDCGYNRASQELYESGPAFSFI